MLNSVARVGLERCLSTGSFGSRQTLRMKLCPIIRHGTTLINQETMTSSSSSFSVSRWVKTLQKDHVFCSTKDASNKELKRCFCSRQTDDTSAAAAKQALGKIEGKLHLAFTCNVCGMRTARGISKHAYEKGVVIVKCNGCDNNHLIADNLDWFKGAKGAGRNIEEIMAAKGEEVRSQLTEDDILEISGLDNDAQTDIKS
ncbi:DNL-type zinc finger protein-like isoform X2 [Lytechinus pictus]